MRVGLVLGAGGTTGGAFHAGVLAALEEGAGWDPRRADVMVGTSAGSITAAVLRAGLSAADSAARLEGRALSADGLARLRRAGLDGRGPAAPRRPGGDRSWLDPSAPAVLMAAARRPWAVRPMSLLAGLLPEGSIGTEIISDSISALLGDQWPAQPMWIAAVHLDSGRLAMFGRPGAPPAPPGEAVAASCAIPGWFRPVRIGDRRYIDGGAHSLTNLAQLSRRDVDLVIVSAPMGRARQRTVSGRMPPGYAGALRQAARAQLAAEAAVLRRRGVEVIAFQPTAADQAVMGPDPMEGRSRAAIVGQVRESVLGRLAGPDGERLVTALGVR